MPWPAGPVAMPVPSLVSSSLAGKMGYTTHNSGPCNPEMSRAFSILEAITQLRLALAPWREGPHVVDGGVDSYPHRFGAAGGVGQHGATLMGGDQCYGEMTRIGVLAQLAALPHRGQ